MKLVENDESIDLLFSPKLPFRLSTKLLANVQHDLEWQNNVSILRMDDGIEFFPIFLALLHWFRLINLIMHSLHVHRYDKYFYGMELLLWPDLD